MRRTSDRPGKRRWFRWIVLLAILGAVGYGIIRLGAGVHLDPDTVLVVDLRSDIPEAEEPDLAGFFGPPGVDIVSLRRALLAAASDHRIRGLLLRVSTSPFGLGRVEEIGAIVDEFRSSRKPVLSYVDGPDTLGYLLAATADEVWLDGSSPVYATGLSLSAFFLEDALAAWGVEADLVRVGEYKGTFEQFTSAAPSEAFDEAMNSLADSLYGLVVGRLARARGMEEAGVRGLIDRAPFTPEEAEETGLVDRVIRRADLRARLDERFRTEVTPVALGTYVEAAPELPAPRRRIAVVRVLGAIIDGSSRSSAFFGGAVGSDTVIQALRDARKDDTVAGILLRIDSPGGTASAAEKIWHQVRETARSKPVVASLGEMAASGGYYVASAADWIVSQPGTLTGSIGIFGGKPVFEKLLEKHGVGVARYPRGRHAGLLDITRSFTPEERQELRGQMEAGYRTFLARVAEGRGMSVEEIDALARGRLWSGEAAAERGLVDELGGIGTAVAKIVGLAKVTGPGKPELAPFPPPPGLWDLLAGPPEPGLARGRYSVEESAAARLLDFRSWWIESGLLGGRAGLVLVPFLISVR